MTGPCCIIGAQPEAEQINAALREGQGLGTLAKRYGLIKGTLGKHRAKCLGIIVDQAQRGGATAAETGTDTPRRPPERPQEMPGRRGGDPSRQPFAVPNPGDDPVTAPRKVVAASIEQRCIDLRAKGKSYADIAAEIGISVDTAQDAVERVLIRTRRGTDAKADLARQLDLARIDRLLAGLWDRATDPAMAKVDVPADNEAGFKAYEGQDKAVDRVTKLLERRAKLLGLDAPQAVAVTLLDRAEESVDFTEIFRVIRKLLDGRFPGATAFLDEGLSHYRVRGEAGIDAFLAGDMALPVASPEPHADASA